MVLCVAQKIIQNVHLIELRSFAHVAYLQLLRAHFDKFLSWAESQSLQRLRLSKIRFGKQTVPGITRRF